MTDEVAIINVGNLYLQGVSLPRTSITSTMVSNRSRRSSFFSSRSVSSNHHGPSRSKRGNQLPTAPNSTIRSKTLSTTAGCSLAYNLLTTTTGLRPFSNALRNTSAFAAWDLRRHQPRANSHRPFAPRDHHRNQRPGVSMMPIRMSR